MPDYAGGMAVAETWSVREAEELIRSLTGVLSVRIVTGTDDEIEEIHVLTTEKISPKQTVRNIESALQAQMGVPLDHRRISIAQTASAIVDPMSGPEGRMSLVIDEGEGRPEGRILYHAHRTETETGNRTRVTVTLEWGDVKYEGSALGADLPRARLETAANATLRAVEAVAAGPDAGPQEDGETRTVALALDGVKVVEAFDRKFALIAVHALAGRHVIALAGATVVTERTDGSVILATLQATDRWVRGRMD